ncbi:MAG: hypothetical protein ACRDP6_44985, partial [Actinoallomurus sp.]
MSTDGAGIAQALRRSPIYVDPAYAGALPKATRENLVKRIRRSPVPIYVVLVPILQGSTWQSSEQVTSVVQSHLGRDGAYVTFNPEFDDVFDVVRWGGTDEQRRSARDAGWAVSFEKRYKTLATRLTRCVDLIATGKGSAAYEKDTATAFPAKSTPPAPKPRPHHGGFPVAVPI